MFVRGVDSAGVEFLDLTKTLDISATGAFLASPRLLRSDQLLNLTIPARRRHRRWFWLRLPRSKRECDVTALQAEFIC